MVEAFAVLPRRGHPALEPGARPPFGDAQALLAQVGIDPDLDAKAAGDGHGCLRGALEIGTPDFHRGVADQNDQAFGEGRGLPATKVGQGRVMPAADDLLDVVFRLGVGDEEEVPGHAPLA